MSKEVKNFLLILFFSAFILSFFFIARAILIADAFPTGELPTLNSKHTKLAEDIFKYKKIAEMDDGTRYVKRLNGVLIKMSKKEEEGRYYLDLLDSLNISEKVFADFQERLKSTKLRKYNYYSGYGVFTVDGFMSSKWGYVYDYQVDSLKGDIPLFVGEHIDGNWYYLK